MALSMSTPTSRRSEMGSRQSGASSGTSSRSVMPCCRASGSNARTTSATSSSRKPGRRPADACPASARASSSSSSTRRVMVSSSRCVCWSASRSSEPAVDDSASSPAPRARAIGVRSSCAASARNRRWWAKASSRRSSTALKRAPSRPSSSPGTSTGMRPPLPDEMRSAASAMAATGRSVRPVSTHPAAMASSKAIGSASSAQRSTARSWVTSGAAVASSWIVQPGASSTSSGEVTSRTGAASWGSGSARAAAGATNAAPSGRRKCSRRSGIASSPLMWASVASTCRYSCTSTRKKPRTSASAVSCERANSSSSEWRSSARAANVPPSRRTRMEVAYQPVSRTRMLGVATVSAPADRTMASRRRQHPRQVDIRHLAWSRPSVARRGRRSSGAGGRYTRR